MELLLIFIFIITVTAMHLYISYYKNDFEEKIDKIKTVFKRNLDESEINLLKFYESLNKEERNNRIKIYLIKTSRMSSSQIRQDIDFLKKAFDLDIEFSLDVGIDFIKVTLNLCGNDNAIDNFINTFEKTISVCTTRY